MHLKVRNVYICDEIYENIVNIQKGRKEGRKTK